MPLLVGNWNDRFVFTCHTDRRIPAEQARVLRWNARTMPEEP